MLRVIIAPSPVILKPVITSMFIECKVSTYIEISLYIKQRLSVNKALPDIMIGKGLTEILEVSSPLFPLFYLAQMELL
jgi:hypothetical protein